MGLVEKQQLLVEISPPLNTTLAERLIDEYISLERRYIQGDWEPAELDGGQFAEILSQILYHMDSGNHSASKTVDEVIKYIDDNSVNHLISPRTHAKHIALVLKTIYKFRSSRGAVHISPTYTPNHMDAKYVIEAVRWSLNETLRIFWTGDREKVAKVIRELLQFEVPAIGIFEDIIRVQRTDIKAEDELILLLHYAGDTGFTRNELGKHSKFSAPTVTRALQKLTAPDKLFAIELSGRRYRLTDLGSKYLRERLADKLLVQ